MKWIPKSINSATFRFFHSSCPKPEILYRAESLSCVEDSWRIQTKSATPNLTSLSFAKISVPLTRSPFLSPSPLDPFSVPSLSTSHSFPPPRSLSLCPSPSLPLPQSLSPSASVPLSQSSSVTFSTSHLSLILILVIYILQYIILRIFSNKAIFTRCNT